MIASPPLVASLVVAGDPGHQLLIIAIADLDDELFGPPTTKRCRDSPVMRDHHVAILPPRPFEALGLCHRYSLADPDVCRDEIPLFGNEVLVLQP